MQQIRVLYSIYTWKKNLYDIAASFTNNY